MAFITDQATALPDGYRHIVLSPHLDDAALSCGGFIARMTAAGERVLVVNVCSGIPSAQAGFSAFAQSLHERWALPPSSVVAHRRVEDAAALGVLGADALLLPELDAIYRCPDVYADEVSLFATPIADDPLIDAVVRLTTTLVERYPHATFYVPLAVGMHVDHQLVFAAATSVLQAADVRYGYYEDFPYARQPSAVEQRLAMIGRKHYAPRYVPLDEALLQVKITAISAYSSQLNVLFGGAAAMPAAVTEYAARIAFPAMRYAERQWVRV
ncbi:PIG-L family deacetylase [Chloroflexus sp. MS-CIW-1]|jgi:LmbE family N-acetylglucosaminyl deacetylase|uniref:PIG-L deacetylase family protein n=1 Tax=Chloroflexus sp. MS-CIW-1 TaxID=3055768 RepID=UPI001B251B15|nr:PIG-L family deacetylase [Chloroflexus sp. MS-CIW-1]MBO9312400.1 PIG-L family deacetylase [Chloroflexus sp.]MBO9338949.1 PIG-L family deacetylase [Chloroflexus sp.]MBO9347921.1 PIG-L family deacetylase [Chloroflexus sp.]MBO9373717.1 PIG-L family deacetylase [Chloroflexus sp.]MDN5273739.1 PIG-L family deacetylase [Chloroflexus sp. MS-CIW-1]